MRRFAYRLALATGRLDVEEIMALPWPVLREWMAYAELEPFGPLRDDLRAGVVASLAVAPWLKKGKTVTPEDIFPTLKDQPTHERELVGDDMWDYLFARWQPVPAESADSAAGGAAPVAG